MDDRYGVPGERSARGRLAEHLPAGCGLGFFLVPVPAWSTARVVAWQQARCGAADELYLLITLMPLLVIGYGFVFAVAYALLHRVVQGWTAVVVAVLVLGAITALTHWVLVDAYASAGCPGR